MARVYILFRHNARSRKNVTVGVFNSLSKAITHAMSTSGDKLLFREMSFLADGQAIQWAALEWRIESWPLE